MGSIVFGATGQASPVNFKLLPLVPAKAEIVSGFQNTRSSKGSGRLLLTTHNNRLDLEDWISLTGVDSQRVFDEVIEVASCGADGRMNEHLLLVAGHFDGARILRAAEENGAEKTHYLTQQAVLIKPFTREEGEMVDTRWLVILNDQIGIFGTAFIVQEALRRYDKHLLPDADLSQRLAQFHPDVTAWNVLAPAPRSRGDIFFAQPHGAWTHLLHDTDLVLVAARFAQKIRIDFLVQVRNQQQAGYFTDTSGFVHEAFAPEPQDQPDPGNMEQPRLQDLQIDRDRVRASVLLSRKQFEAWRDREIKRNQSYLRSALRAHGE